LAKPYQILSVRQTPERAGRHLRSKKLTAASYDDATMLAAVEYTADSLAEIGQWQFLGSFFVLKSN
jgi:hypothetical protein